MNARRVGVVGSGPAGLAAAIRLRQAGYAVRVFEANEYVGGRMKTIHRDGFTIEEGAALMPTTYGNLLGIAREVGLADEIVLGGTQFAIPTRRGVQIIDCARPVRSAVGLRALSIRSKLLLGRLAVDALRHRDAIKGGDLSALAALDDESVSDYVDRRLNREILDLIVDPAVRGIAGDTPDRLSKLDLFYVAGLFAGRMRPLTFRGGISIYPQAIARQVQVSLQTRVLSVERDEDAVVVTFLADREQQSERFDGCVLAIPPRDVIAVHRGLDAWRADFLSRARSTPIVNLTVALRRAPAAEWTYMPIPACVEPDLLLIALFHHYGPGRVPPGSGQVGIYPAPELSAHLFAKPDDACVKAILARVENVAPGLIGEIEFVHVNRWDPLLFVSWPGYYRELARFRELSVQTDRRITLAGDYYSVSSMNSATASGERAARELLTHLAASQPTAPITASQARR
jgi:protoporphyrinogen/coproporphyrinogen III oxidase